MSFAVRNGFGLGDLQVMLIEILDIDILIGVFLTGNDCCSEMNLSNNINPKLIMCLCKS